MTILPTHGRASPALTGGVLIASSVLIGLVAGAQEPATRHLAGVPIPIKASLSTISGVRELRSGHLLVSDAKNAAVFDVDAKTGVATQIGAVGGDETQYAQPGGFYAGLGDTVLLLDRGLSKVLLIMSTGKIVGARSIKENGVTGSSTDDVDQKHVDARALAYYARRGGFNRTTSKTATVDSLPLLRFDAATQHADTVTTLRQPEHRVVQATENFQMTRDVIGTPLDDFGVTADGRVAVARGAPYRVDWYARDGRVTRGPVYDVPPIAFVQAEKDSMAAASHGGGASASMSGGATMGDAAKLWFFASAKAPFVRDAVSVSPSGDVWVRRTQAYGTADAIYDIFDGEGRRVDRVQLPGHVRVIGFGPSSVYAVSRDAATVSLLRYATRR